MQGPLEKDDKVSPQENTARGQVDGESEGGYGVPPAQGRCPFRAVFREDMALELSPEDREGWAGRRAGGSEFLVEGTAGAKKWMRAGARSHRPGGKGLAFDFKFTGRQGVHVRAVTSIVFNSLRPVDRSPPGSSVHGILQARILEWVATPSSRGSSQSRD